MRRKAIASVAAMVAAALTLAACGGESEPSDGDDISLTYWTLIDPNDQDSPRSEALRNEIEAFEDENPEITINVETLPWAQISTKLLQASSAGTPPDVVRLLAWDLPKSVDADQLVDLNEYASDEYREDWLLGWDTLTFDGSKYAVPMEYRSPVLFVRTDYEPGTVPGSWQEMVQSTPQSSDPHAQVMIGFSPADQGTAFGEPLVSYLWDAGVELFNEDGTIAFNNEAGYTVFDNFADLIRDGATPDSVLGFAYEDVQSELNAGTSVYTLLGSHRADATRATTGLDRETLRIAPLPSMFGNDSAPAHVNGWTYAIPAGTDHPEAAWKFIEFVTSPERQLANVQLTGELPTRASPYEDAYFSSDEGADAHMLADWFQSNGRTLDYGTHWVEFNEIASNAIATMVQNNTSGQEAVTSIAEQYNPIAAG